MGGRVCAQGLTQRLAPLSAATWQPLLLLLLKSCSVPYWVGGVGLKSLHLVGSHSPHLCGGLVPLASLGPPGSSMPQHTASASLKSAGSKEAVAKVWVNKTGKKKKKSQIISTVKVWAAPMT